MIPDSNGTRSRSERRFEFASRSNRVISTVVRREIGTGVSIGGNAPSILRYERCYSAASKKTNDPKADRDGRKRGGNARAEACHRLVDFTGQMRAHRASRFRAYKVAVKVQLCSDPNDRLAREFALRNPRICIHTRARRENRFSGKSGTNVPPVADIQRLSRFDMLTLSLSCFSFFSFCLSVSALD